MVVEQLIPSTAVVLMVVSLLVECSLMVLQISVGVLVVVWACRHVSVTVALLVLST